MILKNKKETTMNILIKEMAFWKVPEGLGIFDVASVIKPNALRGIKLVVGLLIPVFVIIYTIIYNTMNYGKTTGVFLLLGILFYISKKQLEKYYKNKYKTIIEERYSVDLEDKDFLEFINKYFGTILRMDLSKLEEKDLVKNWKKQDLKDLKDKFKKEGQLTAFK